MSKATVYDNLRDILRVPLDFSSAAELLDQGKFHRPQLWTIEELFKVRDLTTTRRLQGKLEACLL